MIATEDEQEITRQVKHARAGVCVQTTGMQGRESVPPGPQEMWAGESENRMSVPRRSRMLVEGTFAGTDHLQHHLRRPSVVQPCLLVQEPLLLHLFLLGQSQAHGAK